MYRFIELVNNEKYRAFLLPSDESYNLVDRWQRNGLHDFLDLGCGLGRHSILFANQKKFFNVTALDISSTSVSFLKLWAKHIQLSIDIYLSNMCALPFEDNCFDCVMMYNVITHTDENTIQMVLNELYRVLKFGSEAYITFCSKESTLFKNQNYVHLGNNVLIKNGVSHFCVNYHDVLDLLGSFKIIKCFVKKDFIYEEAPSTKEDDVYFHMLIKK